MSGDFVYQPFEPELDWSKFSVTLPQSEIPRLHEALAAISTDQYKDLQVIGVKTEQSRLLYAILCCDCIYIIQG